MSRPLCYCAPSKLSQRSNGMKSCPACGAENHDRAVECKKCLQSFGAHVPARQATASLADTAQPIRVVNIDMPFWSMVTFMVKWAVATIPAFLLLFAVGAICVLLFGGIGAALNRIDDAPRTESLIVGSAREAMAPGALTVSISEKSDAWWVANETDYMWNICWAERMGQRGSFPTMNPNATVAVRHDSFRPTDGAYAGSDLRIICSYNGADVSTPIRVTAVVKR
jgi:hypothetical protein